VPPCRPTTTVDLTICDQLLLFASRVSATREGGALRSRSSHDAKQFAEFAPDLRRRPLADGGGVDRVPTASIVACPRNGGRAPIAQLDRALVYGTRCRKFESSWARRSTRHSGSCPPTSTTSPRPAPVCLRWAKYQSHRDTSTRLRGAPDQARGRRDLKASIPRTGRRFLFCATASLPTGSACPNGLFRSCLQDALASVDLPVVHDERARRGGVCIR
jgi:hypothetical protein